MIEHTWTGAWDKPQFIRQEYAFVDPDRGKYMFAPYSGGVTGAGINEWNLRLFADDPYVRFVRFVDLPSEEKRAD